MMQGLLLGVFGLATVDVRRVAGSLAEGVLGDFDAAELDPTTTQQYLRTQYMRLANRYGLPAEICNEVAARAWLVIAQLRDGEPDAATSDDFAFYD